MKDHKKPTDSKLNPQRNYKKPWQRPQTAGSKPTGSTKAVSEAQTNTKEEQRKKANEIASKRRQFKPVIVKKTTETEKEQEKRKNKKYTNATFDIDIDELGASIDKVERNIPEPYSAENVAPPRVPMKKINSADVRHSKHKVHEGLEDSVEKPNAKVVHAYLNADEDKVEIRDSPGTRASRMIGDIKKKRKNKHVLRPAHSSNDPKGNQTLDTEDVHLIDDENGTTGVSDIPNENEEEKQGDSNGSNKSKGTSSQDNSNLYEGDEMSDNLQDIDLAFEFEDAHFEEDEDESQTPLRGVGLDEIKEDEEIYDENELEKRELKHKIIEIEAEIKQIWNELINLSDKKTAED
jgi:hypothetical protein